MASNRNRGGEYGHTIWVLVLVMGWCAWVSAQEAVPLPPLDEQDAGPPSSRDFAEILERLRIAESRLEALDGQSDVGYQPMGGQPLVQADGNPPIPSNTERIAALEKALNTPKATTFPNARLTGFFHADAGAFSQDAVNRATLGDIQDGVGFRRARLQAVGNVSDFTAYSVEMDFATAGRPSFLDVWGEQQQLPFFGNLRIGNFRQPTNMDSWTPVRQLWFLERSLPFQAFDPFRRVGIMAYDKSDNEMTSWAYGVYRTGGFLNAPIGDSRFATDIGDQGGFSVAGRLTHLLYYDEAAQGRYLLHVGGNYNYSRISASLINGGVPFYEARAIPEFFIGDPAGGGLTTAGTPFFVDTGRINADSFNLYGVQSAGQYGPAHFQAEYMITGVNQIGNPNLFYDGGYVQAGYFLTGEHRTYNRTLGVFDRIVPYEDFFGVGRHNCMCGWGAWEVAGRVSYLNLNDPNAVPIIPVGPATVPPVPNPGRMTDITLGLNWYWNAYSKVQFNYIHVFLDNAATGNSDCDIYGTRFQVEF